jgi:hypothetical protein
MCRGHYIAWRQKHRDYNLPAESSCDPRSRDRTRTQSLSKRRAPSRRLWVCQCYHPCRRGCHRTDPFRTSRHSIPTGRSRSHRYAPRACYSRQVSSNRGLRTQCSRCRCHCLCTLLDPCIRWDTVASYTRIHPNQGHTGTSHLPGTPHAASSLKGTPAGCNHFPATRSGKSRYHWHTHRCWSTNWDRAFQASAAPRHHCSLPLLVQHRIHMCHSHTRPSPCNCWGK